MMLLFIVICVINVLMIESATRQKAPNEIGEQLCQNEIGEQLCQ
jgi:hypothetical protein